MTRPESPNAQARPNPLDSLPTEQMDNLANFAKARAQEVLKKLPLLGAVSWLMLQQAVTRNGLLNELESRVMPALMLDQAKLYMRGDIPVAYASWAWLSEEAGERFMAAPHRLAMADWKSGTQLWLVDAFTPYGGAREVLKNLREEVHAGHEIRQLAPDDAKATVVKWPPTKKAGN